MKFGKKLLACLLASTFVLASGIGSVGAQAPGENDRAAAAPYSAEEADREPKNILAEVGGPQTISGKDVAAEVGAIIRKYDSSFTLTDYEANVYEQGVGRTTIDFVRMVSGFETNSQYVAMVQDGELDGLYDNTKPVSQEEQIALTALSERLGILRGEEPKELTEALRLAREEVQSLPGTKVGEQEYSYYYNLDSKCACILVFTDCYDDAGAMWGALYTYELALTESNVAFTDVPEQAWYAPYVAEVAAKGLMTGTGAGTFAPTKVCTRAEVVQTLYAYSDRPEISAPTPFTDLTRDWYQAAVRWAYHCGVSSGVSNTAFAPDGLLTREQLVTFLYAYVNRGRILPYQIDYTAHYPDEDAVSGWAVCAMSWAEHEGIISGRKSNGVNYLAPKATATRAEVAAMLCAVNRYLEGFQAVEAMSVYDQDDNMGLLSGEEVAALRRLIVDSLWEQAVSPFPEADETSYYHFLMGGRAYSLLPDACWSQEIHIGGSQKDMRCCTDPDVVARMNQLVAGGF